MRGSISVNVFSGVSLWNSSSTVAKAVRISSSAFDTPCLRRVGRNQSMIPVSKSISVPTTSNVSVLKSRSLISSPRASSRSGYDSIRMLACQNRAAPAARFPQYESNFRERRKAEVQLRRINLPHTWMNRARTRAGLQLRPGPCSCYVALNLRRDDGGLLNARQNAIIGVGRLGSHCSQLLAPPISGRLQILFED